MAAYRRVYDSRHLQADCQEPGLAPEPNARQSSMGYTFTFTFIETLVFAGGKLVGTRPECFTWIVCDELIGVQISVTWLFDDKP